MEGMTSCGVFDGFDGVVQGKCGGQMTIRDTLWRR
jgi:hypothetical protein